MYHGIIIDQQFSDPHFPERFKVFAKKQDGSWVIYGVEIEDWKIDEVIKLVQRNTKEGTWYGHFYNEQDLIVVFKEKVFRVSLDKSSWGPVIEFGKTLNIPPEQLEFQPIRFQDETDYFKTLS